MPIRTNRGRAAVYRKFWGWPLRSPVHLLATVLAVALVAVVIAVLLPNRPGGGRAEGSGSTLTTSATPTQEQPTESTQQTRLSRPVETPSSAPPAPEALQVAGNWAEAWVNHPNGISNEKWLDGLRPYTTEEYLPVMRSVDPANVPASKVTGAARATSSYTSSAEIVVPTDGGELRLSVIRTPQGWRVAGYTKAS
ncbi:MAG: hypothetical protein ACRDQ5_21555 [Sciscionella sp.]